MNLNSSEFRFNFLNILRIVIMSLCIFSCANIKGIDGGPDDKTPPSIVLSKSTINKQLNFKPKKIEFTFDEWVVLNNPNQNIIFSPRLKYNPNIKLKSKTLKIEFDQKEELLDSTTYSVFLGNAIQDLTNKNPAKNIQFVFSTGPTIDSFFITGNVIDAFTRSPKPEVLVILYSNLDDSAFTHNPPNYFTKSDSSGRFRIDYLKPGEYNIFGLIDKNQNYYYDNREESIGFLSHKIIIKDRETPNILLRMSEEWHDNFIKNKKNDKGLMRIKFSNPIEKIKVECPLCDHLRFNHNKDSLLIWYEADSTIDAYLSYENKKDTISLNKFKKADTWTTERFLKTPKIVLNNQELLLNWNEPIGSIDTSKIAIGKNEPFTYHIDSIDQRKLWLKWNSSSSEQWTIQFDSAFIQGIHQTTNKKDSAKIKVLMPNALSKLTVILDSLEIDQQYILQLVNGNEVIEERIIQSKERSQRVYFPALLPGSYKLQFIEDRNRNKIWDRNILKGKTMAEEVWIWDVKELRADWDLEIKFKIGV